MPVRKEDEVMLTRGKYKSNKGKVTCVYRRRWYITVEKISHTKMTGKLFSFKDFDPYRCSLLGSIPSFKLCYYQTEIDKR